MSDYIAGVEIQLFQSADQSLNPHRPKAKIVQCISPKNNSILNKGFAELFSKATVSPGGQLQYSHSLHTVRNLNVFLIHRRTVVREHSA